MAKKILIVDDSDTALFIERRILMRRDYELTTARDGAEAVEAAAAVLPDIIVMDVVMPRVDGIEACRRLRARPETSHIPIILVTTRGQPFDVEAGFAAGCSDYVTKPIDALDLLSKLRRHLGLDRPARTG